MQTNIIMNGDALQHLKELPDESINCVMTSPPYWALRDYGISVQSIWDGNKDCEHQWIIGKPVGDSRIEKRSKSRAGWERPSREAFSEKDVINVCPVCNKEFNADPFQKFCSKKCLNTLSNEERQNTQQASNFCLKCGAWKGQLGLEPTFDLYIKHLCDIFDEVKRVLRKDGTCWVNLGDTYYGSGSGTQYEPTLENSKEVYVAPYNSMKIKQRNKDAPFKSKSLCLIPFRFAIEMQNRGWILRNVIIWHKPNCMPSSVKDRFTVDFEYLFFFVKNKKYWFETQYEDFKESTIERANYQAFNLSPKSNGTHAGITNDSKVNIFKKIQSGELKGRNKRAVWSICPRPFSEAHFATYPEELCETPLKAGCPINGIVLDPFFGAGTTGLVALKQNKQFIGIELNPEYIKIAQNRLKPFLEQKKLIGVS